MDIENTRTKQRNPLAHKDAKFIIGRVTSEPAKAHAPTVENDLSWLAPAIHSCCTAHARCGRGRPTALSADPAVPQSGPESTATRRIDETLRRPFGFQPQSRRVGRAAGIRIVLCGNSLASSDVHPWPNDAARCSESMTTGSKRSRLRVTTDISSIRRSHEPAVERDYSHQLRVTANYVVDSAIARDS